MHIHLRVRHWVISWFYVSVVCGVVAVVNILMRDPTRTQDKAILLIALVIWLLGGLACHAFEGIQNEKPRTLKPSSQKEPGVVQQADWHPASDFVLPGTHKPLLPPK